MIEEIFEQINAAQDHKVKINSLIDINGNQSIQLLLPCGCFQVEYICSERELDINKKFPSKETIGYYEFCPTHLITVQNKSLCQTGVTTSSI